MKNIYTLRISDDTLRVLFTDSIVQNKEHSQRVTTCGIRRGNKQKDYTYWGVTIRNPRDVDEPVRGRQVAFKKAFINFARGNSYSINENGSDIGEYPRLKDYYDKARFQLFTQSAWGGNE